MSADRVASLAAVLLQWETGKVDGKANTAPGQSHETYCERFAAWLLARGVTVGSRPDGPWEAVAAYGRWFVVLEDGDRGSRERQGPFSEAEAVAVRDALNGVTREGG